LIALALLIPTGTGLVELAGAFLPPRPGGSTGGDGGGRSDAGRPQVATIGLYAPFGGWTVVQWKDAAGWHDVDGWQAAPGSRWVIWNVAATEFGKGPFRWAVYEGRERKDLLGCSQEFNLPAKPGELLNVEAIPLPASSATQRPRPTATASPTPMPTPPPSPTPARTAAAAPSATPLPSSTATAAPSPIAAYLLAQAAPLIARATPAPAPESSAWAGMSGFVQQPPVQGALAGAATAALIAGAFLRRLRAQAADPLARIRRSWFHPWVKDIHRGETLNEHGFDEAKGGADDDSYSVDGGTGGDAAGYRPA
jgi:hypothetical protein